MKHKRSLTGLTLALTAILLTACGRTEIHVNDYLSTETKGANGKGSVEWTLDTAAMVSANRDAFRLKDNASLDDIAAVTQKINENLYGSFDKVDALTNGDTVKFVWDTSNVKVLEKAYKIRLLTDEYPLTVSGLPELQQYDPFNYDRISGRRRRRASDYQNCKRHTVPAELCCQTGRGIANRRQLYR